MNPRTWKLLPEWNCYTRSTTTFPRYSIRRQTLREVAERASNRARLSRILFDDQRTRQEHSPFERTEIGSWLDTRSSVSITSTVVKNEVEFSILTLPKIWSYNFDLYFNVEKSDTVDIHIYSSIQDLLVFSLNSALLLNIYTLYFNTKANVKLVEMQ